MHIYYTYMHAVTINKKSHKFEGEWEVVYGRVWKEVREGENAIMIISKKDNAQNVLLIVSNYMTLFSEITQEFRKK